VEQRVVVVTGAVGGIGSAITERLWMDGWQIAAADIDEAGLARRRTIAIQRGQSLETFPVDVSVEASVGAAVEAIHERFGRVDGLVNNAGIVGTRAPIWEQPPGEWAHILAVDLSSVYYCSRAVIPHMLRRGWGRIVNIASIAGKDGNPYAAAYSAAKAGVIGLTKSIAKEVATAGILVNCVTPAEIDTPILGHPPQAEIDRWLSQIPMARLGQPIEVANLVAWLLSDECSFSTGGVFDISGGHSTY
jgi:NAD(P)-dependent dehydrogenase (short-subunit alcohol dehydrogenase family)